MLHGVRDMTPGCQRRVRDTVYAFAHYHWAIGKVGVVQAVRPSGLFATLIIEGRSVEIADTDLEPL